MLIPAAPAMADTFGPEPGVPLRPGTEVPYPAPEYHEWRHMNIVRTFDPNFYNMGVEGIRVRGPVRDNEALCLVDLPNTIKHCYADGKESTSLGFSRGGDVITFNPVVGIFAPVLQAYHMSGVMLAFTSSALSQGYF